MQKPKTVKQLEKSLQRKGSHFNFQFTDDVNFVEKYLDKRYKRVPHCAKTVGEFIEEFPRGIYLITMRGHITVVIDGVLYDTFDCRNRRMWCGWRVE